MSDGEWIFPTLFWIVLFGGGTVIYFEGRHAGLNEAASAQCLFSQQVTGRWDEDTQRIVCVPDRSRK